MKNLRTRIAPTPSGFLHWGNAFSFVLTWLFARKNNGHILLRIDDGDPTRKRPEYVEDIFHSLEWLGIDYDEGPTGPDDFEESYSQRHRVEPCLDLIEKLRDQNKLFACRCSRSSIQRESEDGQHPSACRPRNTKFGEHRVAWRADTENAIVDWQDNDDRPRSIDLHATMRDFVVRRKDGLPAYQIVSLSDDLEFGIDFIVRGEDLLESTAAQIWLAEQLGNTSFAQAAFYHHPLILDELGVKLSKSAGATSLVAMRDRDATPARLFQRLSPILQLPETVSSAEEALAVFAR